MTTKKGGRPKKQEGEVLKTCSVRLRPELLEEIREFSEQTDRLVGNTNEANHRNLLQRLQDTNAGNRTHKEVTELSV